MENQVISSAMSLAPAGHDMSPMALFLQADWVVKSVMIGLLAASIFTWAIIFSKLATFARERRGMRSFEKRFASGEPLAQLHAGLAGNTPTGMAALFVAAWEEWMASQQHDGASGGMQQRLQIILDGQIAQESASLGRLLGFLATVGSAAPFIGLFGTVWGIMNSFTAIAASSDTSLSVVAPGIAEALFATAIGLVAAIPSVIAYNKLTADAGKLTMRLEGFADRLAVMLSRQNDARTAA